MHGATKKTYPTCNNPRCNLSLADNNIVAEMTVINARVIQSNTSLYYC